MTTRQPARRAARTVPNPSEAMEAAMERLVDATETVAEDAGLRAPAREPSRPLQAGEFYGRNGEVLSLKRDPHRDMFDIPEHLKDPDWTYEWKRDEVLGKPDVTHQVHLKENGWREVIVQPGSKWAGHYMPANYVGPIKREGNILMERPKAMTDVVLAQEKQRASMQMRDNMDKYTRRRGAIDSNAAFTTNNPNVAATITQGYEVGPTPGKHRAAID